MPRAPTEPEDTHREEQRKYRDGLRQRRVPEVGKVDTAVAAAVYGCLREPEVAFSGHGRRLLRSLVARATVALLAQGYDPEAARRVVVRRLGLVNSRFEQLLSAGPADRKDDGAHDVMMS